MARSAVRLALAFAFALVTNAARTDAVLVATGAFGRIATIDAVGATDIEPLAGPPLALRFGPDGRNIYGAIEEGIATKIDLPTRRVAATARLAGRPVDLAVSGDGRYVMAAIAEPPMLAILNAADLSEAHVAPIRIENGRRSAPLAVLAVPARSSFMVSLRDIPEVWEISHADRPPYRGWVHDFRDDGPPSAVPRFPIRRIPASGGFAGFMISASGDQAVGWDAASKTLRFLDLYIGRIHASLSLGEPLSVDGAAKIGPALLALPLAERAELALVSAETAGVAARHPVHVSNAKILGTARDHEALVYGSDRIDFVDTSSGRVLRSARPWPGQAISAAFLDDRGGRLWLAYREADSILMLDFPALETRNKIPFAAPAALHGIVLTR